MNSEQNTRDTELQPTQGVPVKEEERKLLLPPRVNTQTRSTEESKALIHKNRVDNEIRLMERVLGSKYEFFYRPEDKVFVVTPKAAEYREIKLFFHLPSDYPLHEPRVQVAMLEPSLCTFLEGEESQTFSDLTSREWRPALRICDMVDTVWDEIESNTIPVEVFQESMAKHFLFKLLNSLGDRAPIAIIFSSIFLRMLVIIYSTLLVKTSWAKPEADQLLHYFKMIRTQANAPASMLAGPSPLHTMSSAINSEHSSVLSPAHNYLLYFISLLAHFILPSTDTAQTSAQLTNYQLNCLLLVGKGAVLLIDSVLLIFSTSIYVRLTYHKFKKQLRACYLAVILLCPAFFLREYMHFDLHCIGHHLLFLALFLHEVGESILVSAISAFLCSVNPVYMLLPVFLLSSQIAQAIRVRLGTQTGIFKTLYSFMDVASIVGSFLFVFSLFVLPWALKQDDWAEGLWRLVKEYVASAAADMEPTPGDPSGRHPTPTDRVFRIVLKFLPLNFIYIAGVFVSISKYNTNGVIKLLLLLLGLGQTLITSNQENSILLCLSIALAGPQELKGIFSGFVFMSHFQLESQAGKPVGSTWILPVLMLGSFTLLTSTFISSSPQDLIREHSLASKRPVNPTRTEPALFPLLKAVDRTLANSFLLIAKYLKQDLLVRINNWLFGVFAVGVSLLALVAGITQNPNIIEAPSTILNLVRLFYFWTVMLLLTSNLATRFLENITSKVKRL